MNYFEKKEEIRQATEKYLKEKTNRRLKHAALLSAAVCLLIMISLIVWMESISGSLQLFLEGCVGMFAIIFALLTTILLYRINKAYINDKYRHNH